MTIKRGVFSIRNLGMVLLFGAIGGVSLWLLFPASGGSGSTSSVAEPASVGSSLSLWQLAPEALPEGSGWATGDLEPATLKVSGAVVEAESIDATVTRLVVPVSVRGDQSIVIPQDSGELSVVTATSETSSTLVPATYALEWIDGNGDRMLDPGEHAQLTIDLPKDVPIRPGDPMNLVIKSDGGARLAVEDPTGN